MANVNYLLQFKRNSATLSTKSSAVEALKNALSASTAKEGEPMIAIYTENSVEKVLFGIVSSTGKYTIFEGANLKEDGTIEIPEAVQKAIEDAITSAKSSLLGEAGDDYNTLGKLEEKIQEEASRADTAEKALGTRIDNLDLTAVGGTGKVITTVSQTDGLVSATADDLTSSDKTISVNGLDLKVNVDNSTIKVNSSNGALYVDPTATSVSGKDAIKVTDNDGKQVELVIATANKVLTQTTAGLDTTLGLKFVKASDNTVDGANKGKAVVQLTGVGNVVLGEFDATDLVMDGVLDKVELEGSKLTFTWNAAAGNKTTEVDLADYIKPYSNGNGINLTENVFSVKVKTDDKYLTIDANGVASKGIDEAITAEIQKLDVTDLKSTGGSKVELTLNEVDGKVTSIVVKETDIASAATLASEITTRKAVTGVDADTYTPNASSNYIKEATSLNDADVKLDAQIKANADKIGALETKVGNTSVSDQIIAKLDELDLSQVGGSGKVITTISQSNGKVSADSTDLTATNVAATKVGEGSATNVQGILGELHTEIEGVKNAAISLKAGNGISVSGEGTEKTITAIVKNNDDYIQVTDDGIASKGIDSAISTAITNKIAELKVIDTIDNEKYVSGVSETDGKITVTRQNILADAQNSVANALQLINGSIYLSTVIDCGTY